MPPEPSPAAAKPLALVTGGVRRLGAAIAQTLADAGYELALSSHDETSELPDDGTLKNANAQIFMADLTNARAPSELLDAVAAHFGRLPQLIVNNAAIFGQDDWTNMSAETMDAHYALNFRAPIMLTQLLAARLAEGARANIVHILDQRVQNPVIDQASYTLSKQALAASIRSSAKALAPKLRVNGVAPGLTLSTEDYTDSIIAQTQRAMPLGLLPAPQEIAAAVLYLANAQSTTGQVIFVDAGAHLESFKHDFMHFSD